MNARQDVSRRVVLKGLGTTLVLPLLDSLRTKAKSADSTNVVTKASGRGQGVAPPRLVSILYSTYGPDNRNWVPRTFGKDFELSPTLKPFAGVRDQLSVFNGLDYRQGGMGGHSGPMTFLTGVVQDRVYPFRRPPSIDTVAARHIGNETAFPQLALSVTNSVGARGGYYSITVDERSRPVTPLNNPRQIFSKLFVNPDEASRQQFAARLARKQSILDLSLEQFKSIQRNLGQDDRKKLDEYASSIRSVEQQLARDRTWLDRDKPEVDPSKLQFEPVKRSEYLEVLLDLMFLALQTDSTRVLSLAMAYDHDDQAWYEDLSERVSWHNLQHHKPGWDVHLPKVDLIQTTLVGRFLDRLQGASEGDSSLLDNTLVYYGTTMNNDGGGHGSHDLSLLLAGGARLGIKHGGHIDIYAGKQGKDRSSFKKPPITNLFLTMLQALGVPGDRFENSTGTLAQLT